MQNFWPVLQSVSLHPLRSGCFSHCQPPPARWSRHCPPAGWQPLQPGPLRQLFPLRSVQNHPLTEPTGPHYARFHPRPFHFPRQKWLKKPRPSDWSAPSRRCHRPPIVTGLPHWRCRQISFRSGPHSFRIPLRLLH